MPGMSGENLCSLIRADHKLRSVSIIIVCSETAANLQRCAQCGANAFISSPVNTAVLLQEAHQLLHITQRKTCRIPLKVRIEGRAMGKPFTGSIENISTAGLLIHTDAVLFEGDDIQCSFDLQDSGRIYLSAEVVRTVEIQDSSSLKKYYGVRFTDIGDADASDIEAFMKTKPRTASLALLSFQHVPNVIVFLALPYHAQQVNRQDKIVPFFFLTVL